MDPNVRYVPIADTVTLGDDGSASATDAPLRVEQNESSRPADSCR